MARRSEHSQEKLKEMAIDAGFKLLEERGLKDFQRPRGRRAHGLYGRHALPSLRHAR